MLTLYTFLLTVHILAVIVWMGSAVFAFLISRQVDAAEGVPVAAAVERAATVFPVAGVVAAASGIGLWIDGPWGLGELWILIAVVGWLASSAIGGSQISPAVERWAQGDTAGAIAYQRVARVDLAILTLVVIDMVIKPGA